MKLFRDMEHPQNWIAYGPEIGWVSFPAGENGWDKRQPARGLDPIHLREVPITMATKAGLKLAPSPATTYKKVA